PHYPFEFIQFDALEVMAMLALPIFESSDWVPWRFDGIHASPPCQAYSDLGAMWPGREHPDLVGPTRTLLQGTGLPWVIENVEGAPLHNAVMLCGSMFDLGVGGACVRRHRLFEMNLEPFWAPQCQHPDDPVIGVYGGSGGDSRRDFNTQHYTVAERRIAMGIDWMTGQELSQAIPPAYTEWIGTHPINAIKAAAWGIPS